MAVNCSGGWGEHTCSQSGEHLTRRGGAQGDISPGPWSRGAVQPWTQLGEELLPAQPGGEWEQQALEGTREAEPESGKVVWAWYDDPEGECLSLKLLLAFFCSSRIPEDRAWLWGLEKEATGCTWGARIVLCPARGRVQDKIRLSLRKPRTELESRVIEAAWGLSPEWATKATWGQSLNPE